MAGNSEVVGEKDEPPAAASPKTEVNVENGFTAAAKQDSNQNHQHVEEERDEFGLPMKVQTHGFVNQYESDSEAEESQAYGTPHERLSRTVTPRPPQANGVYEPKTSEKPTLKQAEAEEPITLPPTPAQLAKEEGKKSNESSNESSPVILTDVADRPRGHAHHMSANATAPATFVGEKSKGHLGPFSEHSHQALAPRKDDRDDEKGEEEGWKVMPAFAPYDMYDDNDRLFAREEHESDKEDNAYSGLGGAGKGYTRVQVDEDAKSATSMDENTDYLFKPKAGTELHDEDEDQRDPLAQLQATKTLLSETQRIAYVGVTRLAMAQMLKELEDLESMKKTKKEKAVAVESMKMWGQKMMVRLYGHMDINSSEQIMIEQLAEHGVEMGDMTPALMQNARVKNPMAMNNSNACSKENLSNSSKNSLKSDSKNNLNSSSKDDLNSGSKEKLSNSSKNSLINSSRNSFRSNPTPNPNSGSRDNLNNAFKCNSNGYSKKSLNSNTKENSKDNPNIGSKNKLEDETKDDKENWSKDNPHENDQVDLEDSSRFDVNHDATSNRSAKLLDESKNRVGDVVPSGSIEDDAKEPSSSEAEKDPAKSSFGSESRVNDGDDPVPEYKEHEDAPELEDMSPAQLGTDENIDLDLRWTVLCDLFLVLLIDSNYDARSRILLEKAGEALQVSWVEISRFEKRVTDSLEMQQTDSKETWDEAEHLENRRKLALRRRYMMMGLATVGGSLVIGLSAGALAPVIGAGLAAGFTTIGVTGTSAALTGAGASAIITTGALGIGGRIGLNASNRRTGAVKTFEYRPLHNNKRVNLIVTVSGWMSSKVDDVRLPFSTVDPIMGDIYSVLWEPEMLTSMGDTINILASEALTQTIQQVLGSTILITLMAAIQLPIVLSKLSYLIDNPWTVSMARANAAGLILADSLIDRNLGTRPVTLVGFSLGARVIFACLRELSNRGAYGIIQNVYLFGSPIIANKDEYCRARSIVSGRFVNGYANNDWILGYLFRATGGGIMRVAGLAKVEGVTGIENIDVTEFVNGHMAYRAAMPKILRRIGWEVESDEFAEIEDPDPENHAARQRELLREIDEARKAAGEKPQKKRFGFFGMGKVAEKKKWEIYNEKSKAGEEDFSTTAADGQGNVLFDIEAIKRELESEQIEVTQLESTLPPIRLNVDDFKGPDGTQKSQPTNPYLNLRETKSHDGTGKGNTSSKFASFFRNSKSSDPSLPRSRENPFDRGYDDYDFPSEAAPGVASTDYGKLSFEELERSSSKHSPHLSQGSLDPPHGSPLRQEIGNYSGPERRPTLDSVASALAPSSSSPPVLAHNAWAHEAEGDDAEFGKEKEISMTFG